MASEEEIKLKNTIAAIYVLDETLRDKAEDLKEKLIKDDEIMLCSSWEEHVKGSIGETYNSVETCTHGHYKKDLNKVDADDVIIRDYEYLERLITEAKSRDESNNMDGLHHDVIIILGHTSVMLAEDKYLIAAFGRIKPTIIAFLGCCGGNTCYGPILTMSYLLPSYAYAPCDQVDSPPSIIAFYRRQVYKHELDDTSLVLGLKYYLHLQVKSKLQDPTLAKGSSPIYKRQNKHDKTLKAK